MVEVQKDGVIDKSDIENESAFANYKRGVTQVNIDDEWDGEI